MRNFRKKLLTAALAAIVAVSASALPAWSEDAPAADAEAPAADDTGASTGGGEDSAITEEEQLAGMELMAENSKLALFVDKKNKYFAVQNKENGYYWWSSFYGNTDKTKQSKRTSLLAIEVLNKENKNIESPARANGRDVGTKISKIEDGVEFMFNYDKYSMNIPLQIKLNSNGSFTATIPVDRIEELHEETDDLGSGYQLINVHILEDMGATDPSSEGFMIVPDGGGAVIEYNNGTISGEINTYESTVYGRDLAVGQLTAGAVIEQITMPVMARVTRGAGEDNGLVMIATQGDAYSIAHAEVTGQISTKDLNSCWFEFFLRTQDKYFIGADNIDPLTVYETKGIKTGDVSVTYYPMHGEDLSFTDAADVYRDYLMKELGVTKKTKANDAPFYLTLYGGTIKQQSVLGFPVKVQTAATTYKQALEIIENLEAGGVSNIKIIYEDFNDAGIVGEVAATFQYSSKLGGKNEYQKLADHINAQGYEIFPSCDIMEFGKSGNGYSFMLNSSKQITNSYATQTPFELAFGLPSETKDSWTILSPYYFKDIFNKLSDSFKKEGAAGISLNQATNTLYSDFSRYNEDGREFITRGDVVKILQNGYQKLSDSGLKIMGENANQYMLKYTDYIKDVPLYSSDYDIISYDIPFAQMVLHGLIPYSTRALNKSANADELRLLSLVTGTPVHYEMMYENPNKFSDSEYDEFYYSSYTGWSAQAVKEYKLFNDVVGSVSDCRITDFRRLSGTQYQSTFENGTEIYVDTGTQEIRVNGKEYRLTDYGLGVRHYG